MDKEQVFNLFNAYIAQKQIVEKAEADYKKLTDELEEPVFPKVCESLDEWEAFQINYQNWKNAMDSAELHCSLARIELNKIKQQLTETLPAEVWFKHGNSAIGIAVSNWGGDLRYVVTETWSDHLSSLDHRHYGN